MNAFLSRPLEGAWPYLWLDATYVKAREDGRIISRALIVAMTINSEVKREVLAAAAAMLKTIFAQEAKAEAMMQWNMVADADNEYAMIDRTIVRAHQHSADAKKAGKDRRSSGGLSTKIHTLVDAPGNPIRLRPDRSTGP